MTDPSDAEVEATIFAGRNALRRLRAAGLHVSASKVQPPAIIVSPASRLTSEMRTTVKLHARGIHCALALEAMRVLRASDLR